MNERDGDSALRTAGVRSARPAPDSERLAPVRTYDLRFAAQNYPGWIGCEYKPSDPAASSSSFGWRPGHAV
jgi:hypothetical protein